MHRELLTRATKIVGVGAIGLWFLLDLGFRMEGVRVVRTKAAIKAVFKTSALWRWSIGALCPTSIGTRNESKMERRTTRIVLADANAEHDRIGRV